MHLKVTREIPLTKVERLWNGPSLRGVKPVLVCFQLFKDKEEVLRKSNMLLKVELYCNFIEPLITSDRILCRNFLHFFNFLVHLKCHFEGV